MPAVATVVYFGERGTGELLVLSQVVLSLQLPFAVIPLVHLVTDRRRMGQYVVKRTVTIAAWLVAAVIVVLNLKLAQEEIGAWAQGGGATAWIAWLVVLPLAAGMIGLLVYITVQPWLNSRRGLPAALPGGVHGPLEMPAVEPPALPRRIAAAVDFSAADTAVLSYAVSLARAAGRGSRVVLLHVVESGGARIMGGDMQDDEAREDQQRLELYRDELGELGVDASYDLGFGRPVDSLAEMLGRNRADLLVLGSHGHRTVGDLIHGTTVEAIRHRVDVPVLVAPPSSGRRRLGQTSG